MNEFHPLEGVFNVHICHNWDTKSFHFETSQHEALECETFTKNMHGKNQDGVCHVTGNKHEENECKL